MKMTLEMTHFLGLGSFSVRFFFSYLISYYIFYAESLKNAMEKLIISNNLPLKFVESEALLKLVKLLNPTALGVMVKVDAITDHVIKMYYHRNDQLKASLAEDAVSINCTCDVHDEMTTAPTRALNLRCTANVLTKPVVSKKEQRFHFL